MRFAVALALFLLIVAGDSAATDGVEGQANAPASADAKILVMLRMAPAHYRPDASYGDGYRGQSVRAARRRIAAAIAESYGLQIVADWPMPALGVECYVMQLPLNASVDAVVEKVTRDARAAWAQPLQMFHALEYNDPLFPLQPVAARWHLQELHAASTGRGVTIATIDSGVDSTHPDLIGQVTAIANFVDKDYIGEVHGTAMAGILVGRANNGVGIVGVAPNASLIALRGCWTAAASNTVCDSFTLARALQAAIERRAQVVTLSLAGPQDQLLRALIEASLTRGMTIVAATATRDALSFPASHPGVLSVAADGVQSAARFSAPGTDVPTTLPGARWGFVSGSSFAAAEVAGLVALVLQHQPSAGPQEIERLLGTGRRGVRDEGKSSAVPIDACRVIATVVDACACECSSTVAGNAGAYR